MATTAAEFWVKFAAANPVPQTSVSHFSALPWTRKYIDDPEYTLVPTYSRTPKPNGEDHFYGATLNNPNTIPQFLTLQRPGSQTFRTDRSSSPQTGSGGLSAVALSQRPDCVCLVQLGHEGLNGHPSTAHGGIVCALLDESMGIVMMLHRRSVAASKPVESCYTANLNTNFRVPVNTPDAVVVKCWLLKQEGKRFFLRSQIVNKQETVLAEANALWIVTSMNRL